MIDLSRPALQVAPDLVGAHLRRGEVVLELTEVEAYEGSDDPASHAFRGPTPRTRVMFGPSGHLYVYLSYGVHLAANIVCGPDQTASAVLLRSARVVAGEQVVRERRERVRRPGAAPLREHELARGPGNLGRVLGLELGDSGSTVGGTGCDFELTDGRSGQLTIASGPRVGVSLAHEVEWRFWAAAQASVSRYARSPRAPRS